MIVVATLLCDRKRSSQLIGIPAAAKLEGDIRLYANIETNFGSTFDQEYHPVFNFLDSCRIPYDYDVWTWKTSSWKEKPTYDQDQRRLDYIITARNMARSYALSVNASHLLFIDADVRPRPNGLKRLLDLDVPLCGGLVPGRGDHSGAHYVFGPKTPVKGKPGVFTCTHGTCGYMLIRRDLLQTLSFRHGRSRINPNIKLSEDPAFCIDADINGFGKFYIDSNAIAEHWDDPMNPLRANDVARDEDIP